MQPSQQVNPDFPESIFNLRQPSPQEEELQTSFTPHNAEYFKRRLATALIERSRLSPQQATAEEFAVNTAAIAIFQDLLFLSQPNIQSEE